MIIKPYWSKEQNTWVFDDENLNIVAEPFVCGMPAIIDLLVKDIKDSKNGFNLIFLNKEFENFNIRLDFTREEYGGYWYSCKEHLMEGWLCDVLLRYYSKTPKQLFILAEELK